MQIQPYLHFQGECQEALNFYTQALEGKTVYSQTYKGSPMENQVGSDYRDKILHATFQVGDTAFMASDMPPHAGSPGFHGVSLSIGMDDFTKAKRVFNNLAVGGTVMMPFEKTFWAEGFGMLKDKFGVSWMVNCEGKSAKP